MKFTIFIPTFNRQEDLNKCLESIMSQSLLPNEILVIDDGNLPISFVKNWENAYAPKNINFIYYKKDHKIERKGLSESKNKALSLIKNNIFFVLDDDVVLMPDFCEKIISVWQKNKDEDLVGVGGLIKNRRKKMSIEKYFYKFFGISSKYSWDVNRIGFQIWDEEIKKEEKGFYAHGGVCSYDLEKTRRLKFSTFDGGRTGLEDVDFCLRAKSLGYFFIIQPKAQLFHYPSASSRESFFQMGYKESRNRKIIFKSQNKNANLLIWIWFYWASLGWIFRQILVGNFSKMKGSIKGLFSI